MTEGVPRTVPATPDAIDAAWLTAVLHDAGALVRTSRVTSVLVGPVDVGGVNGDVYRLLLRYSAAAGPLTLIAKFPASAPGPRGVAAFQRWHEREVRAYRDLAPLAASGPRPAAMPMPACYFGAVPDRDGLLVLLEDLGARNQGDQLAGCSVEDARLAIATIARAHARWWDAPELAGTFDWLPETTVGLDHAEAIQGAFARAWAAVGPGLRAEAAFTERMPALIEAYPDLLAEMARPPVTVIHGDYRLDNLFFTAGAGGRAVRAIDWQFTSRARGMYDVAYFIALDLQPDARRQSEHALIDDYRAALVAEGVQGYEHEAAQRDYALGMLLTFATFVIGAAGAQVNDRMRAVHDVGLHRLVTAILENDAFGVIG